MTSEKYFGKLKCRFQHTQNPDFDPIFRFWVCQKQHFYLPKYFSDAIL